MVESAARLQGDAIRISEDQKVKFSDGGKVLVSQA